MSTLHSAAGYVWRRRVADQAEFLRGGLSRHLRPADQVVADRQRHRWTCGPAVDQHLRRQHRGAYQTTGRKTLQVLHLFIYLFIHSFIHLVIYLFIYYRTRLIRVA